MYINPIGNRQNINSKARLSLISERNLLPNGAVQKLVEKAKIVGHSEDTINVAVQKYVFLKNGELQTMVRTGFLGQVSSTLTHYKETIVSGSFKERQKQAFDVINEYMDNLKKEYEK